LRSTPFRSPHHRWPSDRLAVCPATHPPLRPTFPLCGGLHIAVQFGFDGRGNLTIDGIGATFSLTGKTCNGKWWTFTYDALDRLTNVTNQEGLVAAYTYDALGNRIAKKVNGVVTRFVWRSGHVLYETTDGGTLTVSYQWGLGTDDLLALHDHGTGGHYYVVQDKLHSVRGLVNRDGTWVASWRYRAYGVVLDSAGSAPAGLTRFRWAGAQYDPETGFYFLRTRYYDPLVGRFVQEDKIGRAGGLNLYAYASGRPLATRDPSGTMDNFEAYYDWNVPVLGYEDDIWTCVPYADGCDWAPGGLGGLLGVFRDGVAAIEKANTSTVTVFFGDSDGNILGKVEFTIYNGEDASTATDGLFKLVATGAIQAGVSAIGVSCGVHPVPWTVGGLDFKPHGRAVVRRR